ncbi:hypothetical protein [Azorhizobium doebereinerae]|uniref:hypothetical protein n=1 Tax=Azorhizobium doebereinerae TaxID=281091 RepID=UPI000423DAB1|nr:hypothetical protein [Azorhizobium doebereinerae]
MTDPNTELNSFLETAERLRSRPEFQDALRKYAVGMVRLYRASPILNKLVNEQGRFLISSLALQLHLHRDPADPFDGLTLSRLREVCSAHGVASPGRVMAFLALMRMAGFVEPSAAAGDRRTKVLVPTARMMDHVRLFTVIHLKAIDTLFPGTDTVSHLDRDPGFLDAFHRAAGGYFLRGVRLPDGFPEIAVFTEADAGYMVLLTLFLQLPTQDRRAVPSMVDLPLAAAAKRFGVSRSHMANLFRAAQAKGFLDAQGSGGRGLHIQPALISLVERWFAANMALMAQSAAEAALPTAA